MAYHTERIEKLIEREISNVIFQDVKDDRLKYVTITKVNVLKDLSLATVYYTVLGDDDQKEATKRNLEEAKGFIKVALSKRLQKIRKVPDLKFKYDESLEYGAKIEQIFRDINNKK